DRRRPRGAGAHGGRPAAREGRGPRGIGLVRAYRAICRSPRASVTMRPMRESILVADDEPGVRESLAEVLRDAGYVVETAADGRAALAALAAQDFGVIITDLRIPGRDGLPVRNAGRESSPQTLVLAMTAHGSVDTAVDALRSGATDYMLKPVVFDELLAKVERLLEHRQLVWQTQMLRREVEAHYDF